ncbi:MAG: hypothetical protein KDD37_07190 [Bdellovibrionales bacterium]|nr:hypothetical protein [Bdellovibrionales bacterium]
MLVFLLLTALFAQDKVLLEQGEVKNSPLIISEELDLTPTYVSVQVANTNDIPDYFLSSHVGKSFTEVLKDREKMVCSGTSGFLSCYSCQQENDKFLFTFEFGKKLQSTDCELIRYSVKIKSESNQERTAIDFLKKMGLGVDEKNFATPMVFEKPPLQINLKLQEKNILIDILEPEMQALRASFDSKFNFLTEEVRALWPQYVFLTEQYLGEVGVTKKDILNTKKSHAVGVGGEFVSNVKSLQEEVKKIKSKEERACRVYEDRDLLTYPINEEISKQLQPKITDSWTDLFGEDLKDTVCGNYYFLERVKSDFSGSNSCENFKVATTKKMLEVFLTKNISVLEKQMATIFLTSLEIKQAYKKDLPEDKMKDEIFKYLDKLAGFGDGYVSYVSFKKTHWQSFKPEQEMFRCAL